MKLLFIILLFPIATYCQSYKDLTPEQKHYVDSLVSRKKMIRQSKSHNMMVSFSEGDAKGLEPFFNYMINNLNYYTIKGKTVDVKTTKTGYTTTFYNTSTGYEQKELKVIVNIIINQKTNELQSASMYGPLSLLVDIYLKYFEGTVQEDTPGKGGLDKTYTITDEVRLYSDRITIKPHHNILSKN